MTTPLTSPQQYLIRDIFLFSCFTGIPHCDLCSLTDEVLEETPDGEVWIKDTRGKTGKQYHLILLDIPLKIIRRYRGVADGGRLLPMYDISELNKGLKELAVACGIDRRLTFHMARHTYASEIMLSQGVPIETVSRTLGHGQIKTTQIYAKINNDKIGEDMTAVEERISAKFRFAI